MEQMSSPAEDQNAEQRADALSLQDVPEQLQLAPSELVALMMGEAEYHELMSDNDTELTSDKFDEIQASGVLQDEAIEFLGEARILRLKALDTIDSYPVDQLEGWRQELCERYHVYIMQAAQEEGRRVAAAAEDIINDTFNAHQYLNRLEGFLQSGVVLRSDIKSYGEAFDKLNTAYKGLAEATETIKMTLALYRQMHEFRSKLQARQSQIEAPDILEQAVGPKDKWHNMMGVV